MGPHRTSVVLPGRLIGMGLDVECDVSAVKVSLPGTNLFEYAKLGIHNAPGEMPDGDYQITFAGRTAAIKRYGGAWISRF
jgi:hypothetical protein